MQEERDIENSPSSSSMTPILVVVGALAGLMVLVCGGVAIYVATKTPALLQDNADDAESRHQKMRDAMQKAEDGLKPRKSLPVTHNPAVVTRIAVTIFKIDLPKDFLPRDAEMQFPVTRASFGKQSDDSALLKMAVTHWMAPGDEAIENLDEPKVRYGLRNVESEYGSRSETTLKATRQEMKLFQRDLTVLGQKSNFTFKQGKRTLDNKPVWKIWGGFRSTNGLAAMILLVPESEFDEEAVVRMIEGIRQADKMPPDDDEKWLAELFQPEPSEPGQPGAEKSGTESGEAAKPD